MPGLHTSYMKKYHNWIHASVEIQNKFMHRNNPLPGKVSRLPLSLFHQARLLNVHAVKSIHANTHTHTYPPTLCPGQTKKDTTLGRSPPICCPAEERSRRWGGLAGSPGASSLSNTQWTQQKPNKWTVKPHQPKWRAMKSMSGQVSCWQKATGRKNASLCCGRGTNHICSCLMQLWARVLNTAVDLLLDVNTQATLSASWCSTGGGSLACHTPQRTDKWANTLRPRVASECCITTWL